MAGLVRWFKASVELLKCPLGVREINNDITTAIVQSGLLHHPSQSEFHIWPQIHLTFPKWDLYSYHRDDNFPGWFSISYQQPVHSRDTLLHVPAADKALTKCYLQKKNCDFCIQTYYTVCTVCTYTLYIYFSHTCHLLPNFKLTDRWHGTTMYLNC